MTFRRAAQYTWKAFLTFLMIGVPGILIQVIASWAMGSWAWAQGDNRPDPAMMGGVARGCDGESSCGLMGAVRSHIRSLQVRPERNRRSSGES